MRQARLKLAKSVGREVSSAWVWRSLVRVNVKVQCQWVFGFFGDDPVEHVE